uniref:Uncharacterized protein n=1 Tax=Caenorhabditis japonica TaxID=281687 RepID=A0A8R1HW44_CAEJA
MTTFLVEDQTDHTTTPLGDIEDRQTVAETMTTPLGEIDDEEVRVGVLMTQTFQDHRMVATPLVGTHPETEEDTVVSRREIAAGTTGDIDRLVQENKNFGRYRPLFNNFLIIIFSVGSVSSSSLSVPNLADS